MSAQDDACCDGLTAAAPLVIDNRPGLSAVAYRAGTHSRFKETLLARLSAADLPALRELRTRDDDDLSIALLDAWAATADVVTFYQERIANEAFLRTATERASLLQLARLIGYEPRPGVAASAHLAFTLEDGRGAPAQSEVPLGTRVQSIPGPGQRPQVFETLEAIEVRPEWNAMRPRMTQPHPALTDQTRVLTLRGVLTSLREGASLLLVVGAAPNQYVRRVLNVTPNPAGQTTRVEIGEDPPNPPLFTFIMLPMASFFATPLKLTTATVTSKVKAASWKQADLTALANTQKWSLPKLALSLKALAFKPAPPVDTGVFALHLRAPIFGHNAPRYETLAPSLRIDDKNNAGTVLPAVYPSSKQWTFDRRLNAEPGANQGYIYLDTTYPGIVKGSRVVLESPGLTRAFTVEDHDEVTRSDFTLTAKVSRLKLSPLDANAFATFTLRDTTVLAQSEKLELAELPIPDDVAEDTLVLERAFLGLRVGRPVAVSGTRSDLEGVDDSEVVHLAEVTLSDGYTVLSFAPGLSHTYVRGTVTVNANVALASHGETREETLGSGDATRPFQRFTLRHPPLTYVSAPSPSGAATTLEVRVNGVTWQEVESLYGHGPDEQVYITRTDDEGRTTVQFGDGRTGALLPTGQENVRATYRQGMGAEGLVNEGQLSLPLTRPLGVRSVANPVAAGDAAPAESRDDIRRNAALPIYTLGRIVSLRDYEDFARAFSGVAKALATWSAGGQQRGVFLTVAGVGGAPIPSGGLTYTNLLSAMQAAGDPLVPLVVAEYTQASFVLSGSVQVAPGHLPDAVLAAVERALRVAFAFEARSFGQPVALSEVVATIHTVPGVIAVDLDALHRTDLPAEKLAERRLYDRLDARAPRSGESRPLAAELLTLDPRPLDLHVQTGPAS